MSYRPDPRAEHFEGFGFEGSNHEAVGTMLKKVGFLGFRVWGLGLGV